MVAVAAVCTGTKYPAEWVSRLFAATARNGIKPRRFVLVTDDPGIAVKAPGDLRIVVTQEPGWWAKLELFRLDEPVLYLDLDVVVTGDLAPLAEYAAPFVAIRDWQLPMLNSSVMLIHPGHSRAVWDRYAEAPDKAQKSCPMGDQQWITNVLGMGAMWPAEWCRSYKMHCRGQGIPEGCRVVCFHGQPKMHKVIEPWVIERWY